MKVLRIDASARRQGSKSRRWADEVLAALEEEQTLEVTQRELGEGVLQLDEATLRRFGYLPGDADDTEAAQLSERLIAELEHADAIVLATPIYNFSVPAALKAWIDLVAGSRRTSERTSPERSPALGGGVRRESMSVSAYHLHVYFEAESRRTALRLRERLAVAFPDAQLGRVHEQPVAFHPRPMYQVTVSSEELGPVVSLVLAERGLLSVLVHPLHGDAWVEHTDDAMWIGPPLQLDEARLRRAASAATG